MEQYSIEWLSANQLDRITLPPFQRGFVWTKAKKNDFVQTLHNGYPFGTLLVYRSGSDDGKDLQLLDGQQRLSTIRQYQKDPLQFWKPLNREEYDAVRNDVNALLPREDQLNETEFDTLINDKDRDIYSWIAKRSKGDDKVYEELTGCIIDRLKADIDAYVDLAGLSVPMIVYHGSAEHLADVFANLNKGGIPLTKYEVYSAAWVNDTITLASADVSPLQDRILQYVKQYYLSMQANAEFDLQGFSEDELTQKRIVTLAEFATALGQYVTDNLSALVPRTSRAAQEMGFGLLAVATGLDNRKLKELNAPERMRTIRDEVEDILRKTERICNNLQSMFSKLLRRFKDTGDNYENGLSSTFKTLSYFAALWHFDPTAKEYQCTLHNIKAYYVFDAVTNAWSSHGDQRLLDYQSGKRDYLLTLTVDQFDKAFGQWIDDQTPGINFGKDIKCLVTIHANLSYLAASVPDGETFELEHIIARKRINAVDDASKRKILGSALGNCMYLPKSTNNTKKDKTLYEVNEYEQYAQLIKDSQYFTEDEMESIDTALKQHDYATINNYILKRSRCVADAMIQKLLADTIS